MGKPKIFAFTLKVTEKSNYKYIHIKMYYKNVSKEMVIWTIYSFPCQYVHWEQCKAKHIGCQLFNSYSFGGRKVIICQWICASYLLLHTQIYSVCRATQNSFKIKFYWCLPRQSCQPDRNMAQTLLDPAWFHMLSNTNG